MNFTVETKRQDHLAEERAVALRGRMVSITALEVVVPDLAEIGRQLQEKSRQAPSFFKGAPLLLDLTNLKEAVDLTWLGKAYALMVQNDFMALGVAGADAGLAEEARKGGIPLWPSTTRKGEDKDAAEVEEEQLMAESEADETEAAEALAAPVPEPEPEQRPEPEPEDEQPAGAEEGGAAPPLSAGRSPTRVITTPVRSGQRCYARGGDLIVLASVNTGAEVMADGHIHVYGSLRGRALAGVAGQEDARIFCHDLQADLVAIAGYYLINEDLPVDRRGKAVQISLSGETLHIDPL